MDKKSGFNFFDATCPDELSKQAILIINAAVYKTGQLKKFLTSSAVKKMLTAFGKMELDKRWSHI